MRAIETLLVKAGVDFEKIEVDIISGSSDLPLDSQLDIIKKSPQLVHNKLKVIGDCPALMRYLCQASLTDERGGTVEISNTTDFYPK
jgi:hypothetical protein